MKNKYYFCSFPRNIFFFFKFYFITLFFCFFLSQTFSLIFLTLTSYHLLTFLAHQLHLSFLAEIVQCALRYFYIKLTQLQVPCEVVYLLDFGIGCSVNLTQQIIESVSQVSGVANGVELLVNDVHVDVVLFLRMKIPGELIQKN